MATSYAARKNCWRFSSDSFAIIITDLLPVASRPHSCWRPP
jgi:hypothetical protein